MTSFNGLAAIFGGGKKDDAKKDTKKDELAKLKGIGYVGGKGQLTMLQDWPHLNCVSYNADLDQIMVSSRLMSEFWIIDHATSTAEAAGTKGANTAKAATYFTAGEIPRRIAPAPARNSGFSHNTTLTGSHKACPAPATSWLSTTAAADPAAIFRRLTRWSFRSTKTASIRCQPEATLDPQQALWSYQAPNKTDFYSWVISGAHRLPNGNTIVCEGMRAPSSK